jgi:hypothetical protein
MQHGLERGSFETFLLIGFCLLYRDERNMLLQISLFIRTSEIALLSERRPKWGTIAGGHGRPAEASPEIGLAWPEAGRPRALTETLTRLIRPIAVTKRIILTRAGVRTYHKNVIITSYNNSNTKQTTGYVTVCALSPKVNVPQSCAADPCLMSVQGTLEGLSAKNHCATKKEGQIRAIVGPPLGFCEIDIRLTSVAYCYQVSASMPDPCVSSPATYQLNPAEGSAIVNALILAR